MKKSEIRFRFFVLALLVFLMNFAFVSSAKETIKGESKKVASKDAKVAKVKKDSKTEEDEFHWTPLQLAVFEPTQMFNKDFTVIGWRFNPLFYTDNRKVNGFDLGVGMAKTKIMNGVQLVGTVSWVEEELNGIQIAGCGSVEKRINGIQIVGLSLSEMGTKIINGVHISAITLPCPARVMNGVSITGFVSMGKYMNGFQIAGHFNKTKKMNGVQIAGLLNRNKITNGFQLGVVNWTNKLKGVQIGAVNIAKDNWLPVSIGINLGF